MTFTEDELHTLHDLAVDAATRAGLHIQSRIDNHSGARTKEGGDTLASQLVTEVDDESQNLILDCLADSIGQLDLGLLTEESEDNFSRLEKEAFWCIDPLDGTLPFTEAVPGYSVSIALVSREGTPLIGVVYDPAEDTTYHAYRGSGAYRNNGLIKTSASSMGAPHLTWCMDRSMKKISGFDTIRDAIGRLAVEQGLESVQTFDQAGAVLNACRVACSAPALYFKFPKTSRGGGSVWDFAATACLFEEWGQPPTDIYGDPLDLNPEGSTFMNERAVVYASDPKLREAIYRLH